MILGLLIYSRTKAFRFGRAKRLDNSNEFRKLINIGFKPRIIDTFNVFLGKFKGFHFLVYIDYSDYYFNNDFSIVFVASYFEINNDKFKQLNEKYYDRVKSLLFNMEYVFFHKDFAQFRYTSSVLRIKPNRIQKKLERIVEILIEEKLKPTDFKDFSESVKRNY